MGTQLEKLNQHEKYRDFIVPVDEKTEFRDATYFLRKDGTFIFSEGYCHTPGRPLPRRKIVSHLVFVPQKGRIPDYTKKKLFDQPYENITKAVMNTQPLEKFYPLQLKRYLEIDPSLGGRKPPYARYKVLIPVDSLVGHFPHLNAMRAIFRRGEAGDRSARRIRMAIEASAELLGVAPERIGISGSLSLGTYENPHDLDVVIYARVKEVRRMVDFMYNLTSGKEERKVYEFGKFWPIRYWEIVNGERLMICPFFSYMDLDECPLRDFTCEEMEPVGLEGRVCDHTHNSYNPTLLMMDKAKLNGKAYRGEIMLILYHGGERGDYVEGDRITAEGTRVLITTFKGEKEDRRKNGEFEAVLTTNIGDVRKIV